MSKRTPEEIIHSVERYQRGETSQGAEAKRLGVSQQTFQDWIRKHETFGIDGFEHTGHRNYPRELKKSAVTAYLSGEGSQAAICKKYGISSRTQLQNWIKMYNGHKELKCYTGGNRMTKGRKTTYGHTFTSREQLISTIESYIDYYNNRRYQHRLFIQTPMQAHVCAMNRAA